MYDLEFLSQQHDEQWKQIHRIGDQLRKLQEAVVALQGDFIDALKILKNTHSQS